MTKHLEQKLHKKPFLSITVHPNINILPSHKTLSLFKTKSYDIAPTDKPSLSKSKIIAYDIPPTKPMPSQVFERSWPSRTPPAPRWTPPFSSIPGPGQPLLPVIGPLPLITQPLVPSTRPLMPTPRTMDLRTLQSLWWQYCSFFPAILVEGFCSPVCANLVKGGNFITLCD